MPKKQGRRKRPGRHTVHTRDPRYNVPNYPRGEGDLAPQGGDTLIHGRLKSRCTNCGHIFYGSTIDYHQVCPKCRRKGGVPYHGSLPVGRAPLDKATIIYANDEDEARSKVEDRFGKVKKVEPLGVNHMGNPYFRVIYISTSEEFKEFKNYIAASPNAKELQLTGKEITNHPRLTKAQKKTLYQHIRAKSGNLPNRKDERQLLERATVIGAAGRGEKGTRGKIIYTTPTFKGSIGHYGGYFIDVHPSDLSKFKAMFPKRTFPRKTSIREETVYVDGEPTKRLSVQFRDGTKSIKHLDKLENEGKIKLKIT